MVEYRFDHAALRRLREQAELRPERLCTELNMSKEMYRMYESGRAVPPTTRLLDLCRALGCAPSDLLRPIPSGEVLSLS